MATGMPANIVNMPPKDDKDPTVPVWNIKYPKGTLLKQQDMLYPMPEPGTSFQVKMRHVRGLINNHRRGWLSTVPMEAPPGFELVEAAAFKVPEGYVLVKKEEATETVTGRSSKTKKGDPVVLTEDAGLISGSE